MFTYQLRAYAILSLCCLLIFSPGFSASQSVPFVAVASTGDASTAALDNPDGSLDLSGGFQGTLGLDDLEVDLDTQRGPIHRQANRPAFPTIGWHALSNQGLNGAIDAMAVVGNDLYVGGRFSGTGDGSLKDLGSIVRYNIEDSSWQPLPNQGLDHWVYTMALVGSDLYVGGLFSGTGDGAVTNLGYIVRFDTVSQTWHALPRQGLKGSVNALAVSRDNLYVGGFFDATGDGIRAPLGNIVRYDTAAKTWHAFPSQGLDDAVYTLAVSADDLYLGGRFSQTADGSVNDLGNIARYDTQAGTWNPLAHQGLDWDVLSLAAYKDDLYVGGFFTRTGDGWWTNLFGIARYDPAADSWHAFPNKGLDRHVSALLVSGDDLYAAGGFSQTGDGSLQELGGIVRYELNSETWYAMPNKGMNKGVRTLAASSSDLFAGGSFFRTGDGSLQDLGSIARCSFGVFYLPLVFK